MWAKNKHAGFTIVELLIVVVVIAILSAVTIVAFTGIQQRARVSALQAELHTLSTKLSLQKVQDGSYPSPTLPNNLVPSGMTAQYTSDGNSYCLTLSSSTVAMNSYYVSDTLGITQGACAGHIANLGPIGDGSYMQSIASSNCPTTRVRAVDARDNRTYWVQKLADGKCWMLTNLAYAGGGTNTFGDTKSLLDGTSGLLSFSEAYYYIHSSGVNATNEPTNPSAATTGTSQYGYLYNWCAAMGRQLGTAACNGTTTPLPNTSISICPAGWRLPTGGASGEFVALNNAINAGSSSSPAGLLTTWLGQKAGYWSSGFNAKDTSSQYWSSTITDGTYASNMWFTATSVTPHYASGGKYGGIGVRCVAQ